MKAIKWTAIATAAVMIFIVIWFGTLMVWEFSRPPTQPKPAGTPPPTVGTIAFGTGGSDCSLASVATTFTPGGQIRIIATFSRQVPEAAKITIELWTGHHMIAGYPLTINSAPGTDCVGQAIGPLAAGQYTAVVAIDRMTANGIDRLGSNFGEFDVTP